MVPCCGGSNAEEEKTQERRRRRMDQRKTVRRNGKWFYVMTEAAVENFGRLRASMPMRKEVLG
jgi:hypothetical protein